MNEPSDAQQQIACERAPSPRRSCATSTRWISVTWRTVRETLAEAVDLDFSELFGDPARSSTLTRS